MAIPHNVIVVTMRTAESTYVVREIDDSNFTAFGVGYADTEGQRVALNDWISERANEQHATMLTLISWHWNY